MTVNLGTIKELVSFNFIPKFACNENIKQSIWELSNLQIKD